MTHVPQMNDVKSPKCPKQNEHLVNLLVSQEDTNVTHMTGITLACVMFSDLKGLKKGSAVEVLLRERRKRPMSLRAKSRSCGDSSGSLGGLEKF